VRVINNKKEQNRIMYDKLKIYSETYNTDGLYERLKKRKRTVHDETGLIEYSGYLDNMFVRFGQNSYIIIDGSITKFAVNTNVRTLTRVQVADAFDKLSTKLRIDLSYANVQSYEFGANIELTMPVASYLDLLTDLPHYQRNEYGDRQHYTLYYLNTLRKLKFYNKIKQMIDKGDAELIPQDLAMTNLLRYEIGYKQLGKNYSDKDIRVRTLTEPSFFNSNLFAWQERYMSINKKMLISYHGSLIRGISDLDKRLASIALQDENVVSAFKDKIASDDITKQNRCKLRGEMNKLREQNEVLTKHDIIKEFDWKINEIVSRYSRPQ
jgi:hypothetical protein